MKRLIVSDSSCNLYSMGDLADDCGFSYVPLTIHVGDKEFVDTDSLNPIHMIDEMYAYKGKTSSACPSPDDWIQEFNKADEIFALTITSGLSGCYNSAMLARDIVLAESPEKRIFVMDSLSTGPEMVLIMEKLNELFEQNLDFKDICQQITAYSQQTHLLFKLENMENLVKNGRVSRLVATVADVLNIHVVGRASAQGTLELLHKCRGASRSYCSILKEMILNGYSNGKVIISHCDNASGAEMLKNKIMEAFENPDITIHATGGLCSYYAERHGLLVGYESV